MPFTNRLKNNFLKWTYWDGIFFLQDPSMNNMGLEIWSINQERKTRNLSAPETGKIDLS